MSKIYWEPSGFNISHGYHFDEGTDQFTFCYRHDDRWLSQDNRNRRRNEFGTAENDRRRRSGELYQFAEVSNGTVMEWRHVYGVDVFNEDHWPAVMRLVHSMEYRDKVMVTEGSFLDSNASQAKKYFLGGHTAETHPLSTTRKKYRGIIASGAF